MAVGQPLIDDGRKKLQPGLGIGPNSVSERGLAQNNIDEPDLRRAAPVAWSTIDPAKATVHKQRPQPFRVRSPE